MTDLELAGWKYRLYEQSKFLDDYDARMQSYGLYAPPVDSFGPGEYEAIQMELILRFLKKGYRVVSEPTGLRARMSGASKVMNLRSISSNLRQVFELRWHLWGSNEAAPATSR